MGTNYYVIKNFCDVCRRFEREHIGKSSAGWSFSFQGTDEIRDFEDWLKNVTDPIVSHIEDEYGNVTEVYDLLSLIEKKRGMKNHAKESGCGVQENWVDKYGNSFSGGYFS